MPFPCHRPPNSKYKVVNKLDRPPVIKSDRSAADGYSNLSVAVVESIALRLIPISNFHFSCPERVSDRLSYFAIPRKLF